MCLLTLKNALKKSIRNVRTTHNQNRHVKIIEVGPRDGLQNETKLVPTDVKINFINKLSRTGLKAIEVTSFVSPKWVPQMADNERVFKGIEKSDDISYPVLVPNTKGLESALVAGAKEIAVFASASDSFSQKNVNCSAEEGVNRIAALVEAAKNKDIKIRGYVSCVVGCPYEGPIKPEATAKIVSKLLALGCYEVSLGDTIGVGTPGSIKKMLNEVLTVTSADKLAMHCHDTYGQALANILTAIEMGIVTMDSSVCGLGGCPYAKGASGNVATEDLIYMLHGMGINTGVDLELVMAAGNYICSFLGKESDSNVFKALYRNR